MNKYQFTLSFNGEEKPTLFLSLKVIPPLFLVFSSTNILTFNVVKQEHKFNSEHNPFQIHLTVYDVHICFINPEENKNMISSIFWQFLLKVKFRIL